MLRRIRRLTGETFWVALGHVAAVSAAIVAVAFLTRALGPEAYGQYALATTVVLLVPQFVFTPIGNAGMRFFSVADEAGVLRAFLRGLRKLALAGFLAGVTLVLGFVIVMRWVETTVTPTLAVTAGVFGLTAGLTSLLSLLETAARRRVVVAIHDGLAPWIRLLLAILVLRVAPTWSATGAMLGYAGGALLIGGSLWHWFKRDISRRLHHAEIGLSGASADDREWRRRMVSYGLPFAVSGAVYWTQVASERWALEIFQGTSSVGLYAVLNQASFLPMTIGAALLLQVSTPVVFARAGDGSNPVRTAAARKTIYGLFAFVLAGSVAAAALMTWLGEWVVLLLGGQHYISVTPLLPVMVIASGLAAAAQVLELVPMISAESYRLLVPRIVVGIIATGLHCVSARLYGVAGVPWTVLIAALLYCSWVMVLTVRSARVQRSLQVSTELVS
jgi:O-antigen/teichoic acid export membrane protein